jgi:SAM-dependent methyltransferase
MEQLTEAFRVLGDPTRLRILRLVGAARLNVSEVVSLIGVAQSSVSHHLTKLKALNLIREDRQGGFTYYALAIAKTDALWPLIHLAQETEDAHGDLSRLNELQSRREDAQTLNEKLLEPGQSWALWTAALSTLLPPLRVVDFGCGTGVLTLEIARWAKTVTAIDRNASALAKARAESKRLQISNVTFLEADLEKLPLESMSQDLVVISQSLHHVQSPDLVLREAARILKIGGRVVVLELQPHLEHWVRTRLGHVHLGFESEALRDMLTMAGFGHSQLVPALRDPSSPFKAFLLSAERLKSLPKRALTSRNSKEYV